MSIDVHHLVVIQHGLWGDSTNTQYLAELVAIKLGDQCHVINSDVSPKLRTYDGIDVCGTRLLALVRATHAALEQKGRRPTHISFIGYSMGGLITRYTAGKLHAEGYFKSVKPLNFITIATPHLGSWRMPINMLNRSFNAMVPVVTARSGYQLVLQDQHTWGKPLLCLMSHPNLVFMEALQLFDNLVCMANIHHDRPVPYCTAAIRLDNPYESTKPVAIDPLRYPSIVQPQPTSEVRDVSAAAAVPAHPAERVVRGKYIKLLFVIFLPLAIPMLLYLTITGRRHYWRSLREKYDIDWIGNHRRDGGAVASAAQSGAECPDAASSVADAGARSVPSASLDGGAPDAEPALSEQSVLLHEGIVELPAEVHKIQEWLVGQMNKLPWRKVDVDTQNYHAHAAIIMRNPSRFKHNRDVLEYLMEDCFVQTA